MPEWQMLPLDRTARSWYLVDGMEGRMSFCTLGNIIILLCVYRVRVFGWKKGKLLAILNYHSAAVHCVSFAGPQAQLEDSNLMICGSKDERISLWKLY